VLLVASRRSRAVLLEDAFPLTPDQPDQPDAADEPREITLGSSDERDRAARS